MDDSARLQTIFERLQAASVDWDDTSMEPYNRQPFKALIAAMLSTQTREEQTAAASEALFAVADTPAAVMDIGPGAVREAIRPASFYNNKTDYIMGIAEILLRDYDGEVPHDLNDLMALPGIGYKVAVLVRYVAYGYTDHITVDTHVDRIAKRLGIIAPTVKGTEKVGKALEAELPPEMYGDWNALMVMFGREVCRARGPKCDTCFLADLCPRVGVAAD
ncbi:MAG: endonuclease III [Chloroflexota bacterium]